MEKENKVFYHYYDGIPEEIQKMTLEEIEKALEEEIEALEALEEEIEDES